MPEDPNFLFTSVIPFPHDSTLSRINGAGQTAFTGDAHNPSIPGSILRGVWVGSPGDLTAAVLSGDMAPGTEPGVVFDAFATESLNDQGQVVFSATLNGPGTLASANDSGIWAGDAGQLSPVARTGDPAPGAAAGYTFGQLAAGPQNTQNIINAVGNVAFKAPLRPLGSFTIESSGIFSDNHGSLDTVALEGAQADGLPDGITFGPFLGFTPFSINARGQVAFKVDISDPNALFSDPEGIWVQDRAGELQNVAYVGEELVLGPGDIRTIRQLGFNSISGNNDGLLTSLNDSGQVVFGATFHDGSRAILISNVGVPEPSSAVLCIFGFLAICGSRCRQRFPH